MIARIGKDAVIGLDILPVDLHAEKQLDVA